MKYKWHHPSFGTVTAVGKSEVANVARLYLLVLPLYRTSLWRPSPPNTEVPIPPPDLRPQTHLTYFPAPCVSFSRCPTSAALPPCPRSPRCTCFARRTLPKPPPPTLEARPGNSVHAPSSLLSLRPVRPCARARARPSLMGAHAPAGLTVAWPPAFRLAEGHVCLPVVGSRVC